MTIDPVETFIYQLTGSVLAQVREAAAVHLSDCLFVDIDLQNLYHGPANALSHFLTPTRRKSRSTVALSPEKKRQVHLLEYLPGINVPRELLWTGQFLKQHGAAFGKSTSTVKTTCIRRLFVEAGVNTLSLLEPTDAPEISQLFIEYLKASGPLFPQPFQPLQKSILSLVSVLCKPATVIPKKMIRLLRELLILLPTANRSVLLFALDTMMTFKNSIPLLADVLCGTSESNVSVMSPRRSASSSDWRLKFTQLLLKAHLEPGLWIIDLAHPRKPLNEKTRNLTSRALLSPMRQRLRRSRSHTPVLPSSIDAELQMRSLLQAPVHINFAVTHDGSNFSYPIEHHTIDREMYAKRLRLA
jgi:hypothetical protein